MTASHDVQIAQLARQVRELRDIEEIRELVARYHSACDGTLEKGTHRDPEAIADLFTPDGVWDVPGGPFAGRAEIIAKARELQSIVWIIHIVANPVVAVDGDVARGEFKGFVRSRRSVTSPPGWSIGIYRTRTVRTLHGWRFQKLTWEYLVNHGDEIGDSAEFIRPDVR
jgi:hypothetical protein